MIDVYIVKNGEALAHIEIKNVGDMQSNPPHLITDHADYTVRFMVDKGSAVGLYSRTLYGFPRKYYNVLALVKQALETLDYKELELERDYDPDSREAAIPAALARGLDRTVKEISQRFSRLHRD